MMNRMSPNPYFLGFHFPTSLQKIPIEIGKNSVLILIFLDFIFLHMQGH